MDPVENGEDDIEPLRAFSSFQDPFAAGTAERFTPQQLVNYSFEALQAWAAERDCGRSDEQTPLEFAGQISGSDKPIEWPDNADTVTTGWSAENPGVGTARGGLWTHHEDVL